MNTALHIVLYGIVAATSPLALGATIVVLTSGRGRINGTAFAVGVLVGQTFVIVLLAALGAAWIPDDGDDGNAIRAGLDLVLGGALLAVGWQVLRSRVMLPRPPGPRSGAMHARLERLGPASALGTGTLLGVGGPKRLGLALLAATAIASADLSRQAGATLAGIYILVATVLVWAPVVLYLVFAGRATDWLARRQQWVRAHERVIIGYSSLGLGVLLVVGGMVQLATSN